MRIQIMNDDTGYNDRDFDLVICHLFSTKGQGA